MQPAPSEDGPRYRQIAQDLAAAIAAGRIAPGQQIASERELAGSVGVSRMTARQALGLLVAGGVIESRLGRGYFVRQPRIEQTLQILTSFTEDMSRLGQRPASVVLRQETVPADPATAGALGLPAGAPVHRLERVRLADREPVAIEATSLPAGLLPGLFEKADFGRESLYAVLRRDYGLMPLEAEQTMEAGLPDPLTARALDLRPAAPVLLLTRRTYDAEGRVIEFVRSTYRGDRYRMRVRLAPGSAP